MAQGATNHEVEVIETPAPTANTPNSHLPILIYRNVESVLKSSPELLQPATDMAKKNGWYHGGTFKAYPRHHYHTVTHEAYAVIAGQGKTRLGVGPTDDPDHGVLVTLKKGDVIVQPAGVAHANLDFDADYEYMGFYPDNSPHWDNNFCNDSFEDMRKKADVAQKVPVPSSDLVHGANGPLISAWTTADREYWENVKRVQIAARELCG